MANGIGNKELRKKKVNTPAGKDDMTVVCVARLAQTEKGLDGAGKKVKGCKEQLKSGEYVTIKLSDKPLQINRPENEAGR